MSFNKKKLLKLAKGYRGRGKNCFRIARPRVEKALQRAYKGRKMKKRDMRKQWIVQVNAGARLYGIKYSHFMHGLSLSSCVIDRKILAQLAMFEPYSFRALTKMAMEARSEKFPDSVFDAHKVMLKTHVQDFPKTAQSHA